MRDDLLHLKYLHSAMRFAVPHRNAIITALLKNPPILVLDEATSSLVHRQRRGLIPNDAAPEPPLDPAFAL